MKAAVKRGWPAAAVLTDLRTGCHIPQLGEHVCRTDTAGVPPLNKH